jgi:hypothetical protein
MIIKHILTRKGSGEYGLQGEQMSTDMENWRGNKRARLSRGSRNPKHGKKKH